MDTSHFAPNFVEGRELFLPCCVAVDRSVTPNRLYVSDSENNRVLAWRNASGFANGQKADLVIGQPDLFGANPAAGDSGLNGPQGLAVDAAGNLWVADRDNERVLLFPKPFDQSGTVKASVVLGQPDFSSTLFGLAADGLAGPSGVAVDGSGNVIVADTFNSRVLVFTQVSTGARATKVIGQPGFTTRDPDNTNVAAEGRLFIPQNVAVNPNGNIFVGDSGNSRVLMFVSAAQLAATSARAIRVLGQPSFTSRCLNPDLTCIATPVGATNAVGLATSGDNLLVADEISNRVLFWRNVSGLSSTGAAAAFSFGLTAPPNATSLDNSILNGPTGVAVDSGGGVYVADQDDNRVLAYTAATSGATASRVLGQPGFTQFAVNLADARGMNFPSGIALDRTAQPAHLFLAELVNNRVLGWRDAENFSNGQPADLVLGQGQNQNDFNATGPSPLNLNFPFDVTADSAGQLYVAYAVPAVVAVFNRPFETGQRAPQRQIGMPGTQTSQTIPVGLAVDAGGNLFVALPGAHRVLEFPPGGLSASRVFGQSSFNSFSPNGGSSTPSASTVNFPLAVAVDSAGSLFVADSLNHRVLEWANVSGLPQVAGPATRVFGQADFTSAVPGAGPSGLRRPAGVMVDPGGNLWIGDTESNRLLEFFRGTTPPATGARAGRVVGQPDFNTTTGGRSAQNLFTAIVGGQLEQGQGGRTGLAASPASLFVSDRDNHRILEYRPLTPRNLAAASGDNQTGPAGRQLPVPLVVSVTDGSGNPVLGAAAFFSVRSGQGQLATEQAFTDSNGQASTQATPVSAVQGRVTVRAEVPGVASTADFTINVSGAVPFVGQGGTVNAASFANSAPVSPGAIVAIFGQNFLPPDAPPVGADRTPLPPSLGGVSVTFNGIAAPLFFVSSTQVNCQVPYEISGTPANLQVSLGSAQSDPVQVAISPFSPGVFTRDSSGRGQAAVVNQDFSLNSPDNAEARGNVISIFATGQGEVSPAVTTGAAAPSSPPLAATTTTPIVFIGGRKAEVIFSGLAPFFVGLWQINVRIPTDTPTGSALTIELVQGNRGANLPTMAVR